MKFGLFVVSVIGLGIPGCALAEWKPCIHRVAEEGEYALRNEPTLVCRIQIAAPAEHGVEIEIVNGSCSSQGQIQVQSSAEAANLCLLRKVRTVDNIVDIRYRRSRDVRIIVKFLKVSACGTMASTFAHPVDIIMNSKDDTNCALKIRGHNVLYTSACGTMASTFAHPVDIIMNSKDDTNCALKIRGHNVLYTSACGTMASTFAHPVDIIMNSKDDTNCALKIRGHNVLYTSACGTMASTFAHPVDIIMNSKDDTNCALKIRGHNVKLSLSLEETGGKVRVSMGNVAHSVGLAQRETHLHVWNVEGGDMRLSARQNSM